MPDGDDFKPDASVSETGKPSKLDGVLAIKKTTQYFNYQRDTVFDETGAPTAPSPEKPPVISSNRLAHVTSLGKETDYRAFVKQQKEADEAESTTGVKPRQK